MLMKRVRTGRRSDRHSEETHTNNLPLDVDFLYVEVAADLSVDRIDVGAAELHRVVQEGVDGDEVAVCRFVPIVLRQF